ncbi:hypothetical protein ACFQE5_01885 [Pseudonocardia hispaniensis]|uniref:Uncharacterized protein n=1 Tax=Pseudonocardia hispaniensis TaxID=904933 RepID=A0ABW1IWU7_9PSEU
MSDVQRWVAVRQRVVASPRPDVTIRGFVVGYQPEQVIVEFDDGGQAGFPLDQVSAMTVPDQRAEIEAQAVTALGGGTLGRDRLAALRDAGLQVVENIRPRLNPSELRQQ